jgi:predicted transcriptional regulator
MATKTLGIKVDESTRERLQALADATDRSPHWLMKAALTEYLDREERHLRERREDQERWDRYVLTGDAQPHARVRAWLEALADGKDEPCPR